MRKQSYNPVQLKASNSLWRVAHACRSWLESRVHETYNSSRLFAGILSLVALFIASQTCYAQPASADKEYPIKAAFLFNFTKYVEWPAASHSDSQSPIIITVLGTNPFGSAVETIVEGRSANGRPVTVKYAKTADTILPTHILFIPKTEDTIATAVLEQLQGTPVLTVGESDNFKSAKGMINFVIERNQVRFELNMASVEHAHLKISSQLQKVATKVTRF